MKESKWVLEDVRGSGKPLYFWKIIGRYPINTRNVELAAKFDTQEQAENSSANTSFTFYKAKEIKNAL